MTIDFESIEKTLGYKFNNKNLLEQAFIRRSYSIENGGQNNEVLEFIGDSALDLAVIRIMMEYFGEIPEIKNVQGFIFRSPKHFRTKLDEGQFTKIKEGIVKNQFLAKCIETYGFQKQLLMGDGDIKQKVQKNESTKAALFEAIIGALALDCNWNMDIISRVIKNLIDFEDYFKNIGLNNYFIKKITDYF